MSVTSVHKDPENLTLTVTAEFDAPPERVWQLWADPRQFERWWGAPGYPATATALDLRTGGKVEYHLSGPDGDTPNNVWEVVEADPPRRLVLRDAIVDENDVPVDQGPSSFTVRFDSIDAGPDSNVHREQVPQRRSPQGCPRHGHGQDARMVSRADACSHRRVTVSDWSGVI